MGAESTAYAWCAQLWTDALYRAVVAGFIVGILMFSFRRTA